MPGGQGPDLGLLDVPRDVAVGAHLALAEVPDGATNGGSITLTLSWVTVLPLARLRSSGSRVRRPVRRILFTVRFSFSAGRRGSGRPCVAGTTRRVGVDHSEPRFTGAPAASTPGHRRHIADSLRTYR